MSGSEELGTESERLADFDGRESVPEWLGRFSDSEAVVVGSESAGFASVWFSFPLHSQLQIPPCLLLGAFLLLVFWLKNAFVVPHQNLQLVSLCFDT